MKNLAYRILVAIILLPAALFALFYSKESFSFLLGLSGIIIALEIAHMISPKNLAMIFLSISSFAFILAPVICGQDFRFIFSFLVLLLMLYGSVFLFSKNFTRNDLEKAALIFCFILYVYIGLISSYLLRTGFILDEHTGIAFILIACIATWSNDIFAYFGGKSFGKTKLISRVSPNKTWEGFFLGSIGSIICTFGIYYIFQWMGEYIFIEIQAKDIFWITIPALVFAPVGDLIESKLKRLYEVKDSSKILPGHGGFFDRIDSLLLVISWTYFYAFIIRSM